MIVTEKLIAEECMAEINCAIHKLQESKDRLERLLGRDNKAVVEAEVKAMTLDEAIAHAEQVAKSYDNTVPDCECAKEHRQLAAWLRELQERRKMPEIIYCKDCNWNDGTCYCNFHYRNVKANDHCSWAERRTE